MRARELAEQAIEIAQRRGTRFWEVEARVGGARLLLRTGGANDAETIEENLERATVLIDETGGEVLRPAILELRAELAGRLGDPAGRATWLRDARSLYDALGADGHARRLAAAG